MFSKLAKKLKRLLVSLLARNFLFSELDFLIAPEISDDEFSKIIAELSMRSDVQKIIEIGSSSGSGSTKSFVEAISKRNDRAKVEFYCMEVSTKRFSALKKYVYNHEFAVPLNLSSVSTKEFPSEEDIIEFYKNRKTNLNRVRLKEVLRWREQDISYINESGRDICGIAAIKQTYGIENFDLCLIDGSEFTGLVELQYLTGAKLILLDDTETYKCREAFENLEKDKRYRLVKHNPSLRNGFALFEREPN